MPLRRRTEDRVEVVAKSRATTEAALGRDAFDWMVSRLEQQPGPVEPLA